MKDKKVDWTFNLKKLPKYDQEYLRLMIQEILENKSFKNSGKSFLKYYPNANNFTMFNNKNTMQTYMNDFSVPYAYTSSHLLDSKKYWLAWTYYQENIRKNEKNIIY